MPASRVIWGAAVGLVLLIGPAAAPPRQEATPDTPAATEAAPATPTGTGDVTPFALPTWVSPTPDADGAIIVIVQPGDSLWVIAARAGLTVDQLRALNSLTAQSVINPGDALVVGYVTPLAVAPEETATPTPPPPTPRPSATPAEATICLTAFDDLDRDGSQDPGEPLRAGVAFTIYNTQTVAANYITDGRSEPKCLPGLAPGEYRVTRSVAPGEILTTAGDWALSLAAGSELRQTFGSFVDAAAVTIAATPAAPTATEATAAAGLPPAAASAAPAAPSDPSEPPSTTSPTLRALAPRLAAVAVLFLGGLLLLGAVLILLLRQAWNRPPGSQPADATDGGRRFRNIDDLE